MMKIGDGTGQCLIIYERRSLFALHPQGCFLLSALHGSSFVYSSYVPCTRSYSYRYHAHDSCLSFVFPLAFSICFDPSHIIHAFLCHSRFFSYRSVLSSHFAFHSPL